MTNHLLSLIWHGSHVKRKIMGYRQQGDLVRRLTKIKEWYTDRQQNDFISLLLFFENKKSKITKGSERPRILTVIFNEYGDVFEETKSCCSGMSHNNVNIKNTQWNFVFISVKTWEVSEVMPKMLLWKVEI